MKKLFLILGFLIISGCNSSLGINKKEPKIIEKGKVCIKRVNKLLIIATYNIDKIDCNNIKLDIAQSNGIVELTTSGFCSNSIYAKNVTINKKFYLDDIKDITLSWNGKEFGSLPKVGLKNCYKK